VLCEQEEIEMLHNQDSDTELQVKSFLIPRLWTGYPNNALKYSSLRFFMWPALTI
jgi:hypothetical protein